ncbi:MAG: FdtA/QdtA family cupin domain-containing protein [Opitutales bacterium]|nr:FdtA/QdtA family cupin domain-containing protein [Opitutales bacterium]
MSKDPALIEPGLLELPCSEHTLGNLFFAQKDLPLPFALQRAYYVCGIPEGARRGGHAHRDGVELLLALQGSLTVRLLNSHGRNVTFHLDSPGVGAVIPPGWWVDLFGYAERTITLVLSSVEYSEDNYVRDPNFFFTDQIPPDVIPRSKV